MTRITDPLCSIIERAQYKERIRTYQIKLQCAHEKLRSCQFEVQYAQNQNARLLANLDDAKYQQAAERRWFDERYLSLESENLRLREITKCRR